MLGVKTAALPASLRRTNQRTIISLLMRLGSASRADLAKAAGISQPTAGKITTELLRLGVLQETGGPAIDDPGANGELRTPRLGRPGQMLRLDHRRSRFVAIELGVSETSLSALPVGVRLHDEWTVRFATPSSPEALTKQLNRLSAKLRGAQLWGVLVSVPGIIDETAGKVLFSPNLHWLEKTNLPELLQQVWPLPVLLLQEIRALALGQLTAEPGGEDFFLVDFGQGVGGAILAGGKLYSHPKPFSGEFGHTPVPGNQRRCGCGAIGCLETLVSERGLLESFRSAANPGDTWAALVKRVTAHGIEPWLAESLAAAARVIAGALNVLGLHRVVVTGLLTELPGCVERLAAEIRAGAMWGRFGEVLCQSAPRRRAAGLVAFGIDRLVLPAREEARLSFEARRRQTSPEPSDHNRTNS
ncbi:MAG TPA: ROK family protein [Candidatus Binatia bacterium]|jgi:predicted NBD/HSP70 family sugar kinase|nr:ROK family protein [Candidatus Binatia bacterium]